jgi:hypothetical protein
LMSGLAGALPGLVWIGGAVLWVVLFPFLAALSIWLYLVIFHLQRPVVRVLLPAGAAGPARVPDRFLSGAIRRQMDGPFLSGPPRRCFFAKIAQPNAILLNGASCPRLRCGGMYVPARCTDGEGRTEHSLRIESKELSHHGK